PPENLTATLIGNSQIQLSWIRSSFFDYLVLFKDGNGTVNHNETARNSQLIINITDPCIQNEASLIPLCQGIVPITSIKRLQIPGVPPATVSKDSIVTTLIFSDL
ncbi:hypothetical protein EMCRGX_G009604, partial [Ephydatia muelleri]